MNLSRLFAIALVIAIFVGWRAATTSDVHGQQTPLTANARANTHRLTADAQDPLFKASGLDQIATVRIPGAGVAIAPRADTAARLTLHVDGGDGKNRIDVLALARAVPQGVRELPGCGKLLKKFSGAQVRIELHDARGKLVASTGTKSERWTPLHLSYHTTAASGIYDLTYVLGVGHIADVPYNSMQGAKCVHRVAHVRPFGLLAAPGVVVRDPLDESAQLTVSTRSLSSLASRLNAQL